ncbi:putative lactate 2-monooxygenase PB1A11.03 [Daldinia childiae]|uniref:putative lactate 2-monooxygenase PB1A11.03 n=1 Tax=Daldinia childiae TaxID=326645 RepID=UPI001445FBEE|nr:putative lactate 2-monooxygenase PB1A11.03 [Daldinia childiae]KAF3056391.1 putative lactate 2-monooxygenase PB1A11.03 [Daldinia childiae]
MSSQSHPSTRPNTEKHSDPNPIAYEAEVYQRGLRYQRPPFTFKPLEWEHLAAERMSADARGYVLGCAGTGETARKNREAFGKWSIVPRRLGLGQSSSSSSKSSDNNSKRNKGKSPFPDLSVNVLGRSLLYPIACAPVGVQKIMNPDGELAAARAAAREGVPFILSTASSSSIEDVARASDEGAADGDGGTAERWFQLYWPAREHDDITVSLLERAKGAGFGVLVVTLDTYILGWRPSDMDNGYNPFLRSDQVGIAIGLSDPVFQTHFKDKHAGVSVNDNLGAAAAEWTRTIFPGTKHTLADVAFLREHWAGPIVLKGIQSASDARAITASGLVDGLVVSNHGGRQADGGVSSLGALRGVVEAVHTVTESNSGGRKRKVQILFDSGIRSGADIAKALALGADMCLVGRPYVYGLVLGGEEGVAHVLRCLLGDLELTLHLSGIGSVGKGDLNGGVLVREGELF